ncbi:hypothetical protein ASE40_09505 [Flavobacterium sp. Root935]|nr:hypothetical protein ASE40_09505 [Flavobacterium sp. Root935]
MPKNKLFQRLNYSLKNYFFYLFSHFIFKNAFQLHLEILFSNLFSAPNIKVQNIPKRPLQFLS